MAHAEALGTKALLVRLYQLLALFRFQACYITTQNFQARFTCIKTNIETPKSFQKGQKQLAEHSEMRRTMQCDALIPCALRAYNKLSAKHQVEGVGAQTKLVEALYVAEAQRPHTLVSGQAQQIFFLGSTTTTAGSSALDATAVVADGSSRFCCQNSQPIHAPWHLACARYFQLFFGLLGLLCASLLYTLFGQTRWWRVTSEECNVTWQLHSIMRMNTHFSALHLAPALIRTCFLLTAAMSASKEEVAQGIKVAQQEMEYKVDLYNRCSFAGGV